MIWNFIRFIGFIICVMAVSHYFLYFSWVRFFDITSLKIRFILISLMSFLTISFILASVFLRLYHNWLTKLFYVFTGLWLGLLIFLIIGTYIIWIIKGMGLIFPALSSKNIIQVVTILIYSLSVILTGYGFINAQNLRVKHISVSIKNLPESWQDGTIVHLSDLHIGSFRDVSFLRKLVKRVNQLNPDVIAITGDLFDGGSSRQKRFTPYLKELAAKRGILFVTGNHEVYAGMAQSVDAVSSAGINVIDSEIVNIDGLRFIGVGSAPMENSEKQAFDIETHPNFQPDLPSVLLYHTPTDIDGDLSDPARTHSKAYLAPETRFNKAIKLGISLQLSGHTHAGQFIPFTWITQKIYNNFHYGLHKKGDFQIYITSGAGTWGPPLRLGSTSEICVISLKPKKNRAVILSQDHFHHHKK